MLPEKFTAADSWRAGPTNKDEDDHARVDSL